ncbi:MAG: bifunctional 3,4-dihydroxy-2-butanone-4-phosphate synthase/GTP cyclohydrolase II [Burkholderiales bacterium]
MAISSILDIIADIRAGRMVVLVDEEDRENEGDLVMAAEFASPGSVNFMARHGRGLICLTLTEQRCAQLNLPLMVTSNRSSHGTNFTVSIEAARGVSTGISAADRARTILTAVGKDAVPADIVQPGHVFPLMARPGGVLVRAGHTEAGCDLAQLAGFAPAAVICEILKDDGEMARLPELIEFAKRHGLKIGTIADLIHYRGQTERLVECVARRDIHTLYGEFRLAAYMEKISREVHLALVKGNIQPNVETLVRVHEPLSALDLLEKHSSAHSWSVHEALTAISRAPCGVLLLLRHPEVAAELLERVQPSPPPSPPEAEFRSYGIGAQILRDLNVGKMRLLAIPRKMPSMAGFGLEITGYVERPVEKPVVTSLRPKHAQD